MSKAKKTTTNDDLAGIRRAHLRFGWTEIAIAFAAGATLELLLGMKSGLFADDVLRKELWSLAHFHAAFLGVVNLVYPSVVATPRKMASRALMLGSALLPLGLFLGGIHHPEGDPGIAIWLAPAGGVLLVGVAVAHARAAWRA
ncbi:MAG TPA: hypothetical protein VGQ36_02025 [Thermoanaerobaculia bacterium]|nr:hypothetical protein [Thermoanaerobaculia bacterium]